MPVPKTAWCRPLTCCTKTGFVPTLNLPHQNRLCIGTKPAFSFWINISTVSEIRCDCQGLSLVARTDASILVFDNIQVLYWPVLGQIHFFCSFDRRCKTCLDTKPVLYQGRFCCLTNGQWDYRTVLIRLNQVNGHAQYHFNEYIDSHTHTAHTYTHIYTHINLIFANSNGTAAVLYILYLRMQLVTSAKPVKHDGNNPMI